ncbi:MAG: 30S ribosomal protein S20 [Omnitrophica bacterium RIFCSPLOWO2_12_FULL_45_13]|nr:MAG: 30S ribosomal protein S20 [Omnitrophica bacterium RIFCSPLOWO2_12_FULL_45_13]
MPIKRASFKDLRKSKKRHLKNITIRTELHTLTKKFGALVSGKKSDEAKNALKALLSKIGKAASKGIIHKNAASRKASRLMKRLTALSKA